MKTTGIANFIHSKKKLQCSTCNSTADEQPDSRQNEIDLVLGV
jgi:hypothetical protein